MTFHLIKKNLSPVLDTQRMGLFAIQNRLNNIGSLSDYIQPQTSNKDTVFSDAFRKHQPLLMETTMQLFTVQEKSH